MTSLTEYREAVSSSLKGICGLSYEDLTAVAADYDKGSLMMDFSHRSGVPADRHASLLADEMTLIRVSGEYGPERAANYNRYQASLWQFANSGENVRSWSIQDGILVGPEGIRIGISNEGGSTNDFCYSGFDGNGQAVERTDLGQTIAATRASLDAGFAPDLGRDISSAEGPRI